MASARIVAFPRGGKKREIEQLLELYRREHPDDEVGRVEPHLVAEWAIKRGLWKRPPLDPEELLRRDLARHLRDEYETDPQGRHVRSNQAVLYLVETPSGTKRFSTWYPTFQSPLEHMLASSQLRRRAAYRDVAQLEIDRRSYNDNNVFGAQLPDMDFDFNKDLAEEQMPTTYPDAPPDDDDDDDDIF